MSHVAIKHLVGRAWAKAVQRAFHFILRAAYQRHPHLQARTLRLSEMQPGIPQLGRNSQEGASYMAQALCRALPGDLKVCVEQGVPELGGTSSVPATSAAELLTRG